MVCLLYFIFSQMCVLGGAGATCLCSTESQWGQLRGEGVLESPRDSYAWRRAWEASDSWVP